MCSRVPVVMPDVDAAGAPGRTGRRPQASACKSGRDRLSHHAQKGKAMIDTTLHARVGATLALLGVVGALAACGESKNDSTPTAAKAATARGRIAAGAHRVPPLARPRPDPRRHLHRAHRRDRGTAGHRPRPRVGRRLPRLVARRPADRLPALPVAPQLRGKPCSIWTVNADGGARARSTSAAAAAAATRRSGMDARRAAHRHGRTGSRAEFGGQPKVQQSSLEVIDLAQRHGSGRSTSAPAGRAAR